MTIRFVSLNNIKYHEGNGFVCCHTDALHAMPPEADLYTDSIVVKLIALTGCAGIIGTVSRKTADLNRIPSVANEAAWKEYKEALSGFLRRLDILDTDDHRLTKPYLHLAIHGMKDQYYGPYAIEIGTRYGKSCSPNVREWLCNTLAAKAKIAKIPELTIVIDRNFPGDKSLGTHRLGDDKGDPGYGDNFHSFQVEIARTLRQYYRAQIAALFASVILEFQSDYVKNYG
jgi:hypothetical protein